MRVLVVCTANVCRSPMAAALLARHLRKEGVDALVSSAGTQAGIVPGDGEAVRTMRDVGLDISAHGPRPVDREILATDGADLVVTMTRAHLRTIALATPGTFGRTFTLRELSRRVAAAVPTTDGERGLAAMLGAMSVGRSTKDLLGDDPVDDVADPYGMSPATYRRTAEELDELTGAVARAVGRWT